MARHSKWHNIKHRKAAQDSAKGKVYAVHSKLITLAAQSGGNPIDNPNLFTAIANAKKAGVPADNIERAIKKGTGEDKEGVTIMQINYEGYAAGGTAIIIQTLTDNKNRTASEMRHIFSKFGGNMGEVGGVTWMFQRKGIIIFDAEKYSSEKIEELVFETEVDDLKVENEEIKIFTSPENLMKVDKFFSEKGFESEEAKLQMIPETEVEVTEFEKALKITKMIEALEENEDVEDYFLNGYIPENLQNEVEEFIEKNSFRT